MGTTLGTVKVLFLCGDISQQDTGAVVNSTNTTLNSNDPVDLALKRAGGIDFLKECRYQVARNGGCPVGDAVVTGAGRLKADYVIHAVGPNWTSGQRQEEKLLRQTYWNALLRADELGVASVAIPCIGAGAQGVPVNVAARIALSAVRDFLLKERSIKEIRFVLLSKYDAAEYEQLWSKLCYDTTLRKSMLQTCRYA